MLSPPYCYLQTQPGNSRPLCHVHGPGIPRIWVSPSSPAALTQASAFMLSLVSPTVLSQRGYLSLSTLSLELPCPPQAAFITQQVGYLVTRSSDVTPQCSHSLCSEGSSQPGIFCSSLLKELFTFYHEETFKLIIWEMSEVLSVLRLRSLSKDQKMYVQEKKA